MIQINSISGITLYEAFSIYLYPNCLLSVSMCITMAGSIHHPPPSVTPGRYIPAPERMQCRYVFELGVEGSDLPIGFHVNSSIKPQRNSAIHLGQRWYVSAALVTRNFFSLVISEYVTPRAAHDTQGCSLINHLERFCSKRNFARPSGFLRFFE